MTNQENKKEKKVSKKTENWVLWKSKQINFYNDFVETILNNNLLSKETLVKIYEAENIFIQPSFISLIEAIIKVSPEVEPQLLDIMREKFWFEVKTKQEASDLVSVTISDMFFKGNQDFLWQVEVDNILNSWILPISIITIKNKNYLNLISRSPEVPENILNIFKTLMANKKIFWIKKVYLCDKETYSIVYNNLTNFTYSNTI